MQLWTDPAALVVAPAPALVVLRGLDVASRPLNSGCPRSARVRAEAPGDTRRKVGFEAGCLGSAPFDCAALAQPTFRPALEPNSPNRLPAAARLPGAEADFPALAPGSEDASQTQRVPSSAPTPPRESRSLTAHYGGGRGLFTSAGIFSRRLGGTDSHVRQPTKPRAARTRRTTVLVFRINCPCPVFTFPRPGLLLHPCDRPACEGYYHVVFADANVFIARSSALMRAAARQRGRRRRRAECGKA